MTINQINSIQPDDIIVFLHDGSEGLVVEVSANHITIDWDNGLRDTCSLKCIIFDLRKKRL